VTDVVHDAPKGAAAARGLGLTSLAALLLFGDWLIEKLEHRPASAHVVEDARFAAESIAVRDAINGLQRELRAGAEAAKDTDARVREICTALRARCR
jgi:hypothetical protein